jgi:hypothetical protein
MEHGDMASEKHSDQLAVSKPEILKDSRLPPSPQPRPPIANDGLESLRSSDC